MDFTHILTSTSTLLLLGITLLSLVILAIYYGEVYFKIGRHRRTRRKNAAEGKYTSLPPVSPMPPVSVVLTAHNEANWLRDNLIHLLEQDYPEFEVVVVNYLSQDDSKYVLKICAANYPNLKVIDFREDVNMFQGKKYPLAIGIREAKHDIILLTEPDSVPVGFNWIREMMSGFHPTTKLMLGYCGIQQEKGLLNALQQYENLSQNAQLFRATLGHKAYSGNGRNMAYRRSFFFEKKGFCTHYSEPYGSDDLFVNQNAKGEDCRLNIQPDAYVTTQGKPTFTLWQRQRQEKRTLLHHHPYGERILRSIYPLSVLGFYAAITLLIVFGIFPWQVLAGIVAIKWAWQIVAFTQLAKRFDIKKISYFSPLFELYFLLANTILTFMPLLRKK